MLLFNNDNNKALWSVFPPYLWFMIVFLIENHVTCKNCGSHRPRWNRCERICLVECVSNLNGLLRGWRCLAAVCRSFWLCNRADDRMQTGKLKERGRAAWNQKVKFHVWLGALLLCLTAPLTPEHDSLVFVRNAIRAGKGGEWPPPTGCLSSS